MSGKSNNEQACKNSTCGFVTKMQFNIVVRKCFDEHSLLRCTFILSMCYRTQVINIPCSFSIRSNSFFIALKRLYGTLLTLLCLSDDCNPSVNCLTSVPRDFMSCGVVQWAHDLGLSSLLPCSHSRFPGPDAGDAQHCFYVVVRISLLVPKLCVCRRLGRRRGFNNISHDGQRCSLDLLFGDFCSFSLSF